MNALGHQHNIDAGLVCLLEEVLCQICLKLPFTNKNSQSPYMNVCSQRLYQTYHGQDIVESILNKCVQPFEANDARWWPDQKRELYLRMLAIEEMSRMVHSIANTRDNMSMSARERSLWQSADTAWKKYREFYRYAYFACFECEGVQVALCIAADFDKKEFWTQIWGNACDHELHPIIMALCEWVLPKLVESKVQKKCAQTKLENLLQHIYTNDGPLGVQRVLLLPSMHDAIQSTGVLVRKKFLSLLEKAQTHNHDVGAQRLRPRPRGP